MFDGLPAPEQLHHFISSSSSASISNPITNINSNNLTFSSPFDPYTTTSSTISTPAAHHYLFPLHHLHQHHHHQSQQTQKHHDDDGGVEGKQGKIIRSGVLDHDHHQRVLLDGGDELSAVTVGDWSNDELLALLRIRSGLENNWFPEFTWEHVSRKLEELGYKKSAEKCKQKFEEESNNYNNKNNINSFRFFAELEDHFYHHPHHHHNENNNHDHHMITTINTTTAATVTAAIATDDTGLHEHDKRMEITKTREKEEEDKMEKNLEEVDSRKLGEKSLTKGDYPNLKIKRKIIRKQKKGNNKFERFKGFCEEIVKRIMEQQEKMHNKMLEDMVKRDEEKFAREESLKKQEMDRVNKDLEIRAHEQAIASDRQSIIINFLKKYTQSSSRSTSSSSSDQYSLERNIGDQNQGFGDKVLVHNLNPPVNISQNPNHESKKDGNQEISTSSIASPTQDNPTIPTSLSPPTLINTAPPKNPSSNPNTSSSVTQLPQNPNASPLTQLPQSNSLNTQNQNGISQNVASNDHKDDIGKRWPRDEVIALINLRCNFHNNNSTDHRHQDKELGSSSSKIPLWERISQAMLELGYKRSAKRCKEKWENINKYFRKTKNNVSKKRSIDSRTCPYFHQLSTLYNQGILLSSASPTDGTAGNRPRFPENHLTPSANHLGCSSSDSTMHVLQGEKNLVQVPAIFDFGF